MGEALEFDESEGPEEQVPVGSVVEEVPEDSGEKEGANVPEDKPPMFNDEQQAVFDREIGRKTAALRDKEREAEEAAARAQELEQKLAEMQAPQRPEVPPMPDPYDDDFEQKIQDRDKILQEAAAYDAQQRLRQEYEESLARQQQEQELTQLAEQVQTYSDRAEKLGIKPDELQRAGAAVARFGIDEGISKFILGEEQGPAMTVYLAEHPMELDKMQQMDPYRAAIYIENEIKPRVANARSGAKTPPPPVDTPKGAAPPADDLPGVVYE